MTKPKKRRHAGGVPKGTSWRERANRFVVDALYYRTFDTVESIFSDTANSKVARDLLAAALMVVRDHSRSPAVAKSARRELRRLHAIAARCGHAVSAERHPVMPSVL